MTDRPELLFVCVHNAGRSQMAAALVEHRAGGRIAVRSAGSEPADALNPVVVEAMAELGIDIRAERPKLLTRDAVFDSDVVITMGCGDACPVFPGKRYEDWKLDDPAGQDLEAVRRIRDEIDTRVQALVAGLLAQTARRIGSRAHRWYGAHVADPVSWLQIEQGWNVVSSDGMTVGTVAQVEGDKESDIFDGLALASGASAELRYLPGEQVAAIYPGQVTVKLSSSEVAGLEPFRAAPPETKWVPGSPSLGSRISRWLGGKR